MTINSNAVASKAYSVTSNNGNYTYNNFRSIFGEQVTSYTLGSQVTAIGQYAFHSCTGMTQLTINGNVTSIGERAIYKCTGLTSVSLPNSITTIGTSAFYGCSGLASVNIPTSATSIGDWAFNGTSIASATIPSGVTTLGDGAFNNCANLTSVTINSNAVASKAYSVTSNNGNYTYNNFRSIFGEQVTSYTLGSQVTAIGQYAFHSCTGMTQLTINGNVTSIGNKAFYGCMGLTSVTLNNNNMVSANYTESSNFKTIFGSQVTNYTLGSNVTAIGPYAFNGSTALTQVTFNGNLTTIGENAFSGCTGLTQITIPATVTTIGANAFSGCSTLATVTINSHAVASTNYSLSDNLKTMFGAQVTKYVFGPNVTAIGQYAFRGSFRITEVTFLGPVSSMGDNAFSGCNVNKVNILSSNLAAWCTCDFANQYANPLSSGCRLYLDYDNVTSITIPNTVNYIGNYAFYRCSNVTSFTIPESVNIIGNYALSCSNLTQLTVNRTTPPFVANANTFANVPTDIPLYVPMGAQNIYRNTQHWSRFTNVLPATTFPATTHDMPYAIGLDSHPVGWGRYTGYVFGTTGSPTYGAVLAESTNCWKYGAVNSVFNGAHAYTELGGNNHTYNWLVSPAVRIGETYSDNAFLTIKVALTRQSGNQVAVTPGQQQSQTFGIYYTTDEGASWYCLEHFGPDGNKFESIPAAGRTYSYNLDHLRGQTVRFGFYGSCISSTDALNRIHIKDFLVKAHNVSAAPNAVAVSEVAGHSAKVSWTPNNAAAKLGCVCDQRNSVGRHHRGADASQLQRPIRKGYGPNRRHHHRLGV